jgi:hypothetical protein
LPGRQRKGTNGPFVQLQKGDKGRSEVVQSVLAQDGLGRLAK